jgi:hypothetical protein
MPSVAELLALLEALLDQGSIVEHMNSSDKLSMCICQLGSATGALAAFCFELFQRCQTEHIGGCRHHRAFLARCFRERNKDVLATLHDSLRPYADNEMLQKIYRAWPYCMKDACTSRVGTAITLQLCSFTDEHLTTCSA